MYKYSNTVFLIMKRELETRRKRLMICLYKNETNKKWNKFYKERYFKKA